MHLGEDDRCNAQSWLNDSSDLYLAVEALHGAILQGTGQIVLVGGHMELEFAKPFCIPQEGQHQLNYDFDLQDFKELQTCSDEVLQKATLRGESIPYQ